MYSPWPELAAHAQSIDFDTDDSVEYTHIPPLIILLRALDKFKEQHGGELPKNYSEKNELKRMIGAMKKGGVTADEENFEDAKDMVMKAVKPTEIPSNVRKLFEDPACTKITSSVGCFLSSALVPLILISLFDASHRHSGFC